MGGDTAADRAAAWAEATRGSPRAWRNVGQGTTRLRITVEWDDEASVAAAVSFTHSELAAGFSDFGGTVSSGARVWSRQVRS